MSDYQAPSIDIVEKLSLVIRRVHSLHEMIQIRKGVRRGARRTQKSVYSAGG